MSQYLPKMSLENEIILELEGFPIKCNKEILVKNSDYFRAMFDGNFLERNKKIVQLKDVSFRAMKLILGILTENLCIVDEDLLLVLKDAVMLQFVEIKNICQSRLIQMLSYENCLNIWQVSYHFHVKPLWVLAKAMALEEFSKIKDTNIILELTFDEIYCYLSQIYLNTCSEFTVFKTVIKWWHENKESYPEDQTGSLLKLLSCVDFKNISYDCFKYITDSDVINDPEISEILLCLFILRSGTSIKDFTKSCQEKAFKLSQTKTRMLPDFPCIIVNKLLGPYDTEQHFLEAMEQNSLYFDKNSGIFREFFVLKEVNTLYLFHIITYKQYMFLYGSGFKIYNFWIYDTIKLNWRTTTSFPCTHVFATCLVGNNLYVVGGPQLAINHVSQNIFWYNFDENTWSDGQIIPHCGREIKCCNFMNKVFIFVLNAKCGYFFNEVDFSWKRVKIIIDHSLLDPQWQFSLVSYKDKLYVKGKKLIIFVLKADMLIPISVKVGPYIDYSNIQILMCNHILYTLYEYIFEDNTVTPGYIDRISRYSLEAHDLETDEVKFIFKDKLDQNGFILQGKHKSTTIISNKGDYFCVSPFCKFFKSRVYSFIAENKIINTNGSY